MAASRHSTTLAQVPESGCRRQTVANGQMEVGSGPTLSETVIVAAVNDWNVDVFIPRRSFEDFRVVRQMPYSIWP